MDDGWPRDEVALDMLCKHKLNQKGNGRICVGHGEIKGFFGKVQKDNSM